MNRLILKQYIEDYKQKFQYINQKEIYKWQAVKHFQDNWNLETDNFPQMLLSSIKHSGNLLKSGQYFPLRMVKQYSEQKPNEIREIFYKLFNEENDLLFRINEFQSSIEIINSELFPGKQHYQDPRAISVYLGLKFPDSYFFYKFEMFRKFSKKLELSYKPIKGRIENIGQFNNLCELIKYELGEDQELLRLHKGRIDHNCYYDKNLHILTQDFIYAVSEHLHIIIPEREEESNVHTSFSKSNNLNLTNNSITFNGRIINFIQNNIENKRTGDLGELWVMAYEIKKLLLLNKFNLAKKVKHISKNEGDGTGYDILSYNEKGKKIFIEVKTTKSDRNTTFYITRSELERSKLEKDNYFVYRVYNFNERNNSADLFIINGDLTNICKYPIAYEVKLSN